MLINIPMLRRGLRRLFAGRPVDIRELASQQWTLCPVEHRVAPAAIHLPGALDKIASMSPWREREPEERLVRGGKVEHAASTAHLVEDVQLIGPCLYLGPAKSQPGYGRERRLLHGLGPREPIKDAHLVTSQMGSRFFGTLLLDDFPLALLPDEQATRIGMTSQPSYHAADYRSLMGLPAMSLQTRAHIDRLTLYTDFAQNSLKSARYRTLRATLRSRLADAATESNPGVYLRRGSTGEPRMLTNEAAVEQALRERGFQIVDIATMSAEQICRASLNARIVAGVEGSHLSHGIFSAADDATFLVLQPPDRFCMTYKEFTDAMADMRCAFLVGDPHPGGFTVPPDDLNRLLDLIQAR